MVLQPAPPYGTLMLVSACSAYLLQCEWAGSKPAFASNVEAQCWFLGYGWAFADPAARGARFP